MENLALQINKYLTVEYGIFNQTLKGVFFYSILLWNITVFKIDILINGLR